jgi:RNA polymerase sigma-70 factor (ECF subfamily)
MNQEGTLRFSDALSFTERETQRRSRREDDSLVELYAAMRTALVSYAYQFVGSTGEAEDLVQVAFLKYYDQMQRSAEIENHRSWLYRVVHNLAIDLLRRRERQEAATTVWLQMREVEDRTVTSEEGMIRRQRIALSLANLNERERHCLLLRAEGLSYAEIGDIVGISAKAVSVYLARGLKKFEADR